VIAPARRAALDVLSAVLIRRADLPDALSRARQGLSDERDRALAADIAIGTVRWLAAIDHIIATASSRPLDKIDPIVLHILRLSIYQLLHLDRVPASAVVDDAVSLARARGVGSAAGFVNAVLRTISRSGNAVTLPPRPDRPSHSGAAIDYLSTTLSHPRWLVERWVTRVGFDRAERWAQFDNDPAPFTVRANTLAIDREALARELSRHGIATVPTRFAPDGLTVVTGHPMQIPAGAGRLFLPQDEASQLVGALAAGAASSSSRALDACASPGGKTLVLAAALARGGLLVATDLRSRRVRLLRDTLTLAGATRVHVVRLDVARTLPFGPVFDLVLLDAPCSGLGILRRDPEIRWRRQERDLPVLAAAQHSMLGHAAAVVRPGGRLVYSTCSSEPEENEDVVGGFLRAHRGFDMLDGEMVRACLPRTAGDLVEPAGWFHTWPWRDGLEAFFAAVLVRQA
jgi:16S rRNA (cytosine967-C5)-methyltransferase